MAHKAVEMKRSERSDAEIQLSKQVVQTFPREELRFKLGAPTEQVQHSDPGVLVVTLDGAFLSSERNQYQNGFRPKIGLSTFDVFSERYDDALVYADWEMGTLDKLGNFHSLHKRQQPK